MNFVDNFPHAQVGKEPKRRTRLNNMSCESYWDEYTDDGIIEATTSNNYTYSFGRRRWVKSACKWRTSTPQSRKEETVLTDARHGRPGSGMSNQGCFRVWERGTNSNKVKKLTGGTTRISKSPQKPLGIRAEATKKPGRWSTFGKFKVDSNKAQKTSATSDVTRKQWKHT